MDLGFHQSHLFVLWFVKLFSHTHTSLFSLPYKDFSTFVEKFFLEVHATYLWPSWCRNRLSNCSFIQHIFTERLLCVRYIIPAFKDPAVSCDTWNNCTRTIKTGYLPYIIAFHPESRQYYDKLLQHWHRQPSLITPNILISNNHQ